MIYLRLTMSLDFALSQGKAPHVTDLPDWMHDSAITPKRLHFASLSIPQIAPSSERYCSPLEVNNNDLDEREQACRSPIYVIDMIICNTNLLQSPPQGRLWTLKSFGLGP